MLTHHICPLSLCYMLYVNYVSEPGRKVNTDFIKYIY